MAYTIHKSDGTVVTVADNTLDPAYYNGSGGSLGLGQGVYLVGRNTIDYGAAIAQNILQMTENFASGPTTSNVPADATSLQGQLWFNKTSGTAGNLYVKVSGAGTGGILNWQQVVTVDASGNSTINGNLLVNGTTHLNGNLLVTGNEEITGDLLVDGNEHILGNLVVDGTITAEGGKHVPVVNPTAPVDGDIQVIGSVISIYANGAWRQIFPALYS